MRYLIVPDDAVDVCTDLLRCGHTRVKTAVKQGISVFKSCALFIRMPCQKSTMDVRCVETVHMMRNEYEPIISHFAVVA